MKSNPQYKNTAGVDHPATIIYLIDISQSMRQHLPDGKSRIEIAKDVIQAAYSQMIQRSLRQGKIYPRYRVGMIAYSSDIYDAYGGIITVDKLKDEGVPLLTPQKGTNIARALRYAHKLIQDDVQKWTQEWLEKCPPPLLINLTDAEYDEESQDALEFAKKIQEISVPDGNVLVENIFITDKLRLTTGQFKEWKGYRFDESTGDPYGDKLLAMSSAIPFGYAQIMNEQAGLKIREGTAMMFPGVSLEFIRTAFVMSTVTGSANPKPSRNKYPEDIEGRDLNRISNSSEHKQVASKSDEVYIDIKEILNEIGKRFFKISIGHPKLIAKGQESPFVVQLYFEGLNQNIKLKIKEIVGENYDEQVYDTELKLGQVVKVKLFSPDIFFSEAIIKKLDSFVNSMTFLGKPLDTCQPSEHKVIVSVIDNKTNIEYQSEIFSIKVIDYAFDHVSRPLLSKASAFILGIGSFAMFVLTFLEQIDKTIGYTSGTAAGVLAMVVYTSFYNFYQRIRQNIPKIY